MSFFDDLLDVGVSTAVLRMKQVAEGLGLELYVEGEIGVFTLRPEGAAYRISAGMIEEEGVYLLRGCSNVRFPLGRLPGEVCSFLIERNKDLPGFDWAECHGDEDSYFYLKCVCKPANFIPEKVRPAFVAILTELLALDRTLQKKGYVRQGG